MGEGAAGVIQRGREVLTIPSAASLLAGAVFALWACVSAAEFTPHQGSKLVTFHKYSLAPTGCIHPALASLTAILGAADCTTWDEYTCDIYLPVGLMQAWATANTMLSPVEAVGHAGRHCFDADFHGIAYWIEK